MNMDPGALSPFDRAYLEPGMPADLVQFIAAHVDAVAAVADAFAAMSGGAWSCYVISGLWRKRFHEAGIRATAHSGEYREAGGIGHAWLSIGAAHWLFDPTAAQFRTKYDLGKYMIAPGEGNGFRSWRRDERSRER